MRKGLAHQFSQTLSIFIFSFSDSWIFSFIGGATLHFPCTKNLIDFQRMPLFSNFGANLKIQIICPNGPFKSNGFRSSCSGRCTQYDQSLQRESGERAVDADVLKPKRCVTLVTAWSEVRLDVLLAKCDVVPLHAAEPPHFELCVECEK
jgi:hypothetical protein